MRVISFSLFGDHPKYHVGAMANLRLARTFYPDWDVRYYIGGTTLTTAIDLAQGGAQVIRMGDEPGGLYWRFNVLEEIQPGDYAIIRDTDSRLGIREALAVRDWMRSGRLFHIMRDHPKHAMTVMLGMFGVTGPILRGIKRRLQDCPNERSGAVALFDELYQDRIKANALEHGEFNADKFPDQKPFPARDGDRFVGEIFDELGQPNDDWKERSELLQNHHPAAPV